MRIFLRTRIARYGVLSQLKTRKLVSLTRIEPTYVKKTRITGKH